MAPNDALICLHTALRVARTHRWVSDWLFTSLPAPFHTGIVLPPHAFQAATAWNIQHTVCPQLLDSDDIFNQFKVIFIPVAFIDGIIVGYTHGNCDENPSLISSQIFPKDDPFETPFWGRFAYETNMNEVVHIVQKRAGGNVGVHYTGWRRETHTDHCSFIVPNGEYSFENLPNAVLTMAYSAEFRTESAVAKSAMHGGVDIPETLLLSKPPLAEPVDALMPISDDSTRTSHLPWIIGQDGRLADGGCLRVDAEQTDTSSGAFRFLDLMASLASIDSARIGEYYVPTTRLDVLQELTGELCSMYTGRGLYKIEGLGRENMKHMQVSFAGHFFMSVLGVAPDQRLLTDSSTTVTDEGVASVEEEERRVEGVNLIDDMFGTGGVGEGNLQTCEIFVHNDAQILRTLDNEKRGWTGEAETGQAQSRTAIRIAPAPKVNRAAEGPLIPPNESKAERQMRLARERSHRNRLSAARSNERKKMQLDAMKKEISGNLEKAKLLKERRDALRNENDRLKRLATGVGAGE